MQIFNMRLDNIIDYNKTCSVMIILQRNLETEFEKARRKSLELLKNLSIDEKLAILGEIMDAIASIKISMFVNATGCSREEAIRILRKRLMKLQEDIR